MKDQYITSLRELLELLESRAKDFEKPLPTMNKQGEKEVQEWHCHSRAAGIRDAANCIRVKFNL